MLRYLKRLEDKDIALNRSMIPLGSCTMKLNATAEMIPITCPASPTSIRSRRPTRPQGYPTLIAPADRLAAGASPASPPSRCSRTPARRANIPGCWRSAPSTRRAARAHRDVCLIPSSAHGTNPASAAMAGLQRRGGRLRPRRQHRSGRSARQGRQASRPAGGADGDLSQHARRVRGGDPRHLRRSCTTHGGQVYMDGANMNAQVGLTSPGVDRRRCVPSEPAQDVLHSAWRRRPGRRADRRRGASGAVSAEPSAARGCRAGDRRSARCRRRRSAAR